jgi:hypothetical protein
VSKARNVAYFFEKRIILTDSDLRRYPVSAEKIDRVLRERGVAVLDPAERGAVRRGRRA